MKLSICIVALLCTGVVLASRRQIREVSPHFTCGPQGIKRFTNQTGPEPVVLMTCPYSVETDMTVEITCAVMSRSFALIAWLYNGEPIDNPFLKTESLTCHQKLKIKYAMTSDSGNYTCQVTNTNGSVTKACLLKVKGKNIQVHIEKVEIDGGRKRAFLQGSVNLTCIMFNVEYPLWKKDGQLIHSGRHVWRSNIGAHGIMFHLEINNVTKSDEGRYECIGTNHHGMNATEEFYLETEPCPAGYFCPHNENQAFPTQGKNIQVHIEKVEIDGGRKRAFLQGSVNLTCIMFNVEYPLWKKDGQLINSGRHAWRRNIGAHGIMFHLEINNVTKSDEGRYECIGTKHGMNATEEFYLETEPCPAGYFCPHNENQAFPTQGKNNQVHIEKVEIDEGRKRAFLQGSVNLTCIMFNVESALWKKDGQLIHNGHVWRSNIGAHGIMFHLEINNVTKSDEGRYECIGTKHGMNATEEFYLETEPCPAGYFCPHNGNQAFPTQGKNNQVHIEKVEIDEGRKRAFLQGSVNLTCIMFNVESALWKKDGQLIHSGHVWRSNIGAHGIMFHLEINNVTKSDEGRYECIGTKHGMNATEEFYLETEPCPAGYFCPHNGNQAFPTQEIKTALVRNRSLGTYTTNYVLLLTSVLVVLKIPYF
ncbi:hemicentin-1-like isoform X3 [Montipora capricornis]|uniref:hemicentin-1-like isoform X3 n=1 Tax=Montipora capricornis TaxID=246305 RepID=UPI0035F15968